MVWTVVDGRVELPCIPSPAIKNDKPVLILWFRQPFPDAIYT